MGEGRCSILYVDDEQANLETFERAFRSDFTVKTCLSGKEALALIEKGEEFPVVVADQRMPGMSGIELCERLFQSHPETIRIILTAYTETEYLLGAIRRGHVQDYIVKPWKKSELKPVLDKAFADYQQKISKMKELESRVVKMQTLEDEIRSIYDSHGIVGQQTGLSKVMEIVRKAAPTDSTILVLGETGTGKELLARAIHTESKRRQGPFVPVHCAALAKSLLESELFGHEKGSFTGADQMRLGRFEMAKGGTIFLDEIGEIPEELQVKLLRVLQEREIQRVGGNRIIPVDVRLVAATNRNLEDEVKTGRFREDLFYRLNVISIRVPSLRERRDDIPQLATYFLKKYCGKIGTRLTLPTETIEYLKRYDWPGNVRELENVIERAVILSPGPTIDPENLNLNLDDLMKVEKVDLEKIADPSAVWQELEENEKKSLRDTLLKAQGNISEAARMMGIARTSLVYRLKKYRMI